MAVVRKTKNRMRPFSNCPSRHRGFGSDCNRCLQSNELEVRANELALNLKNKVKVETYPSWVGFEDKESVRFVIVKAGGTRVSVSLSKLSFESALTQAVHQMRSEATRLMQPDSCNHKIIKNNNFMFL